MVAIALLAGSSLAARARSSYSVTPIPLLKGASAAYARAVNNNGEVVGTSTSAIGWYWRSSINSGSPVAIQPPAGTTGTGPRAINNHGYVIGLAPPYVFAWKYGVNSNKAALLNHYASNVLGLNDSDQIISTRNVVSGGVTMPRGCEWEKDASGQWQVSDLPPLAGDNTTEAQAISSGSIVVGISYQTFFDANGNETRSGAPHLIE